MSPFEIGIIVVACCLPIVALIMILPKQLKKKASKKIETKPEQVKEVAKPLETPQEKPVVTKDNAIDRDMKSFLDKRKESHPAPTKKDGDLNELGRYNPNLFRRPITINGGSKKESKPISDQIDELSPELKALIFSGALERKNFDEDNNT